MARDDERVPPWVAKRDGSGAVGPTFEFITHETAKPQRLTWIWKNWIQALEVTLFTGKRGTGKSKLLHKLVAYFARRYAHVWLWIGVEEQRAWERRAQTLGSTHPGVVAFVYSDADHPALHVAEAIDHAQRTYGRVDGVVIDPVSRIVSKDNDNPLVREAVERLSKLPVTIIAVKHTRKGATGEDDDSRGAGEWQDVPAGHLRIERVDDNRYVLGKHKQREGTLNGIRFFTITDDNGSGVALPRWDPPHDAEALLDNVLAEHYANKRTRANGSDVDDLREHVGDAGQITSKQLREINAALEWGKDRVRIRRTIEQLGYEYTPPNVATGLREGVWMRVP